jgi:hypothetical protein
MKKWSLKILWNFFLRELRNYSNFLRNWVCNSERIISLHQAWLVPGRSIMRSDLPGTSKRNGRHRIMQSLLVVLTLILINMTSHLFCMQVLTIVPSVAPSGCRLRTSLNGISLALLFQHACWRCPSCYRPWCSTCTLRRSIRIWKGHEPTETEGNFGKGVNFMKASFYEWHVVKFLGTDFTRAEIHMWAMNVV